MIRKVGPPTVAGRFPSARPVRLAIGVYRELWGELLAYILGREEWIEVVARAAGEDELGKLTSEHTPDVILLEYEGFGPGAAGLVGKSVELSTLLSAVRAVASGEVWANRKTAAQALEQLAAPLSAEPDGRAALTRREWEVIEGVGHGLRNREIARTLGISEKTVKTHLNHIFTKLHVESRFTLALWAQGGVQPRA